MYAKAGNLWTGIIPPALQNKLNLCFSSFLTNQFHFLENLVIVFHILCYLIINIFQVNIVKKLKFYYSQWSLEIHLNDLHSCFVSLIQRVITISYLILWL